MEMEEEILVDSSFDEDQGLDDDENDTQFISEDDGCGGSGEELLSKQRKAENQVNVVLTIPDNLEFDNKNNGDDLKLLEIFPEEIWAIIADEVQDSQDLENCASSSHYFRKLLSPKGTTYLFPKVWNILGNYYYENSQETETKLRRELFETHAANGFPPGPRCTECGKVREVHWYCEMLKLRLVSKNWCKAITNFYDELQPPSNIPQNKIINQTYYWLDNVFRSAGFEENGKLNRHFLQSHGAEDNNRSPILGRRCTIYFSVYSGIEDRFIQQMGNILRKYGHFIWYCHIDAGDELTSAECYLKARELISLMPNLKVLELTGKFGNDRWNRSNIMLSPSEAGLAQLRNEIRSNPFPRIGTLETIRCDNLPSKVLHELLCTNNHVKGLEVNWSAYSLPENYDLFRKELRNLKDFRLRFFDGKDMRDLELFGRNWKLEILDLDLRRMSGWADWFQIFKMLEENWKDTIVDLTVYLPELLAYSEELTIEERNSLRLELPMVKRLSLGLPDLMAMIDFILPMKNTLQFLEVVIDSCKVKVDRRSKFFVDIKKKQIIEFVGWTDRLLESNIWKVCGKLKEIVFCDKNESEISYKFTREEYEVEAKESSRRGLACACGMNKAHNCFQ